MILAKYWSMAMRIVALKRNRKQTKADYQFIVLATSFNCEFIKLREDFYRRS
jgi:hypothetical protein